MIAKKQVPLCLWGYFVLLCVSHKSRNKITILHMIFVKSLLKSPPPTSLHQYYLLRHMENKMLTIKGACGEAAMTKIKYTILFKEDKRNDEQK